MSLQKCCANCKWWELDNNLIQPRKFVEVPSNGWKGMCVIRAPVRVEQARQVGWPVTNESDRCGEFETIEAVHA